MKGIPTKDTYEIRIMSRGGQGAVTAAKAFVAASIENDAYAQAIPSFGQERRGAAVLTFARFSKDPITIQSYVYHPDIVVGFDMYLLELGMHFNQGVNGGATFVVNTATPEKILNDESFDSFAKIGALDAWKITNEMIGRVPPNAAMLGAFAKTTGLISVDSLLKGIDDTIPPKIAKKNKDCAVAAFERTEIYER